MSEPDPQTIVVTAWGRAPATPDTVVITLAVEVTAPTPGAALQDAADRLAALIDLLDEDGVAKADRRTTGLSVHPRWNENGSGTTIGHQAGYGLEVLVRDLDAAGRLVQRAAERVGEPLRVHQFGLSVRDIGPQLAEARKAAVRETRISAEQIAEAAGVALGPLVSIVEGPVPGPIGRARAAGHATLVQESGPAIEPGTSHVSVGVTATYGIAPLTR